MWIELPDKAVRTLSVTTEHILGDPGVYPPLACQVTLTEEVESAGTSTTRIIYEIKTIQSPKSSAEMQRKFEGAIGASFELLLSERGCILGAPKTDGSGPLWLLSSLGEDLRTAWVVPDQAEFEIGTTWQERPAMPRDMPDDILSASAKAQHRVTSIDGDWLEIQSAFELSLKLTERGSRGPLHGGGKQKARLHRTQGIVEAHKETRVLANLASGPEPAAILSMKLKVLTSA
jgi:hypothetical protein